MFVVAGYVSEKAAVLKGASSRGVAYSVFQELASVTYADVLGEDGEPAFVDMPEKYFKLCGFDTELAS